MMLKEAGEFATHLKRCEKDIRALKNATEGQNSLSNKIQCLQQPTPLLLVPTTMHPPVDTLSSFPTHLNESL